MSRSRSRSRQRSRSRSRSRAGRAPADSAWAEFSSPLPYTHSEPGLRPLSSHRRNSNWRQKIRQSSQEIRRKLEKDISPYFRLRADRDNLLQSAMDALASDNDFKRPLKVYFGRGEVGLDHGGLQVELFSLLGPLVLDARAGLFTVDDQSQLAWFNAANDDVDRFELVGMLVGLAVYNGCSIGVSFPEFLYERLVQPDAVAELRHVEELSPRVAASLRQLLDFDGDFGALGLEFEFSFGAHSAEAATVPMCAEPRAVTAANVAEYVRRYVELTFDVAALQWQAFARGWRRLVPDSAVRMFLAAELRQVVEGDRAGEIAVAELEAVCEYEEGYDAEHPTVLAFWNVVRGFSPERVRELFEFVTACARVPVTGLRSTPFLIRRNGPDSEMLPTAMTCFGRLLLPEYSSEAKMATMLTRALEHTRGFGLL
ncbi:uncharacterized protein V1510DRAFT_415663 [Dipodascopsis tothii]|uniref:uncharacterized protein n=1 Tax=Dipodascopsis tothii TaxID=44089 RepID=UPI0034CE19C0